MERCSWLGFGNALPWLEQEWHSLSSCRVVSPGPGKEPQRWTSRGSEAILPLKSFGFQVYLVWKATIWFCDLPGVSMYQRKVENHIPWKSKLKTKQTNKQKNLESSREIMLCKDMKLQEQRAFIPINGLPLVLKCRVWGSGMGKSWHRNLLKPWKQVLLLACGWQHHIPAREKLGDVQKTVNKLRHEWLLWGQDRSKVSFLFIEIRFNQEEPKEGFLYKLAYV